MFFCFMYFTVIFFIPKKAILYSNAICVRRYFLNYEHLFRGLNDEIFLKDVVECKKYDGKRYRFDRTAPYAIYFFNWDDLIEIRTEEKKYLVPLKNSDKFVEEVNNRIEKLKPIEKENDETSQSDVPTNMFQFDLQRGYMPDCDEIVLGVNGVEFKTDKTTADLINVKSISFNDIQLCKKSDKHSINGIDSDNIVEITTATQTYYIPIKNPYDFINELYKKFNTCNQ